jgi:hypothetical protein
MRSNRLVFFFGCGIFVQSVTVKAASTGSVWAVAVSLTKLIEKKTAKPFKNSVVIGHWHKNAKVTAIKQQKSK